MNNEKKFIKLTPFKMQVLQSFPFIDEDFDAITNYELLCKVVEYLNKTVNNVDLLNEKIEEFQNYFDNLDVQEEINNKLDEMAESGELTDIIAQYLSLAGVLAFNTISDMKNATNLVNGSITKTLGYNTLNDGGASLYKIRNITNEDVVDECSIVALTDTNLIAELINYNILNIKQFGCIGNDEFDNTNLLNKAIDYCNNKKIGLYIPSGTYIITNSLNKLNTDFKLFGDGKYSSIIKLISNNNVDVFTLENQYNIYIHDIGIITDKYTIGEIYNNTSLIQRAINTTNSYQCIFENIHVCGFNQGIGSGYYSWINKIVNSTISYCTTGIVGSGGESNSYNLDNVNLEYCNTGILFSNGYGNSIHNCCIENNNNGITQTAKGTVSIHDTYFENNITDVNIYSTSAGNPDLTLIKNCYFYITQTTPRIKINNPNYDAIINIENNYFRCQTDIASTLLDYYSSAQYSKVMLVNNYLDSNLSYGNSKFINEFNLNNGVSSSTAKLNSRYTIQASNTVEILPINNYSTVGNKLTIENNKIKIGKNIKKIKISACLDLYTINATGDKVLYITKNGTILTNFYNASVNTRRQIICPEFVTQVAENDEIGISVYGSAGDVINGGTAPNTYLTVEEII